MPRFLVSRSIQPLTPAELNSVGKQVKQVCSEIGMHWIRSYVTADGKHTFCEFEAPSAEACLEHARRAGLPVDEVIPVGMEIGPTMFD